MKRQTNISRQSLLATIATIMVLGACGSTFAQGQTEKSSSLSSSASQNLQLNLMPNKFDVTNLQPINLFAAKFNPVADYPKPDFSTMEKWYEIVKWTMNFQMQEIDLVIKAKTTPEDRYTGRLAIRYYDEDGADVIDAQVICCPRMWTLKGDTEKANMGMPTESQWERVKKAIVYRVRDDGKFVRD